MFSNLYRQCGRVYGAKQLHYATNSATINSYLTASTQQSRTISFVQGQSPWLPEEREYFYYIDHQGQLFLSDTKVKNFITCFKDKAFLSFFFKRLRLNNKDTDRYGDEFQYVSLCGVERNFACCDDVPYVFTNLISQSGETLDGSSETVGAQFEVNHSGLKLTHPLIPESLCMLPRSGRVYHAGPPRVGGVALVRSNLAIQLARHFRWDADRDPESDLPCSFDWGGTTYKLNQEVMQSLSINNNN